MHLTWACMSTCSSFAHSPPPAFPGLLGKVEGDIGGNENTDGHRGERLLSWLSVGGQSTCPAITRLPPGTGQGC